MPRIEQHPPIDAPYNVSIDELASVLPPDEREDVEDDCVWSVVELPPLGSQEDERRRMFLALSNLIRRHIQDLGIPRLNAMRQEVFGRFSIGEFTSDREMRFFIDHPAAIGPELVRRLQTLLADEFPLWRIVPQYEHLVLGVYPDGVWLGSQPDGHWQPDAFIPGRPDDDDPRFLAWSSRVRELAESRLREHRRGKP